MFWKHFKLKFPLEYVLKLVICFQSNFYSIADYNNFAVRAFWGFLETHLRISITEAFLSVYNNTRSTIFLLDKY